MPPFAYSDQARDLLDVLIRAGLIVVLVLFCFQIFRPFLNLMLWSLILAVTLYPLHRWLRERLGGHDGGSATLLVLVAVVVLLVPLILLGTSLAESVEKSLDLIRSSDFRVRPPAASVANWPLIGQPLYDAWLQASIDFSTAMQRFAPQIKAALLVAFGSLAGLGIGLLIFIVALIIATTKASLVAMFFMHLKGERPMVTWPLALTAFLFVGLLASLLLSEADHLFGARFQDAFKSIH